MSVFARLKKAREEKKGFTLVELIVVLVILAILAAILVPALLGWIDKAKEKQFVLDARSVYMATQTVADEWYAKNTWKTPDADITLDASGAYKEDFAKIQAMADVAISSVTIPSDGWVDRVNVSATSSAEKAGIKKVIIKGLDGDKTATLEDGTWTITDC